jgi:pimeloyl-ACP methyl ester carboxylesterase
MTETPDLLERVQHGYADNNGVKIHYATLGKGPLMVMIHGFPDFWYTWRNQMDALSDRFHIVAVDLRGYNESDGPKGVENYTLPILAGDITAVIRHLGRDKAIVVGHDWGGAVAWQVAMSHPDRVDRLIICNLPHLRGLRRELSNNPQQRENSQYAGDFQQEGSHNNLTMERLTRWIKDEDAKQHYVEAFNKSDFEAMLNYYKANYPREPYAEDASPLVKVQCPVLMIHGLNDRALLPGALNDTWEWLEKDLTLVTIPGVEHFIQHDAADFVNRTMRMWLNR